MSLPQTVYFSVSNFWYKLTQPTAHAPILPIVHCMYCMCNKHQCSFVSTHAPILSLSAHASHCIVQPNKEGTYHVSVICLSPLPSLPNAQRRMQLWIPMTIRFVSMAGGGGGGGGGVHAYVPHLRAAHACSCIYNVMLSCWTTRILFVSDWFKIWRICSCISFNLHFEAQRSFGPQAESAIARCNTLRFTMRKHGVRFSAL